VKTKTLSVFRNRRRGKESATEDGFVFSPPEQLEFPVRWHQPGQYQH
jgi:hypothetical protein